MGKVIFNVFVIMLAILIGANVFSAMLGRNGMAATTLYDAIANFSKQNFENTKMMLDKTFILIDSVEASTDFLEEKWQDVKSLYRDSDWGAFDFLKDLVDLIFFIPELLVSLLSVVMEAFMFTPVLVYLVVDLVIILKDIFNLIFHVIY